MALLQCFGGKLPKISLQKLLFLFTNRQKKPAYDFVPYLYGCFSFSATADLLAMIKHKQIKDEGTHYAVVGNKNFIKSLSETDKKVLSEVQNAYGKLTTNSLMKLTYLNYSYYAINSIKAKEILTAQQLKKVLQAKPTKDATILYTIGYEGISLEGYLNKLIMNDVKVLVDVRNNPVSMKFGFSKSQLKTYCESLNIEYVHVPEVGIESDFRQHLKTQKHYDDLFDFYKSYSLKESLTHQKKINKLLLDKKRIALTCFESNICQCHRKPLAEAIIQLNNVPVLIQHL